MTDYCVDSNATDTTLDAAAAVDKGGGDTGFPSTGHNYIATQVVTFAGAVEPTYNAAHTIKSVTANEIVVTITFVAETFLGDETVVVTPDGKNWRGGYASIELALSRAGGVANTDRLLLIDDHNGATAGGNQLNFPSSFGLRVLSVTAIRDAADQAFSAQNKGAIDALTGSGDDLFIVGFSYVSGVQFEAGPTGTGTLGIAGGNANSGLILEDCNFKVGSGSSSDFQIGPTGSSAENKQSYLRLINPTFIFGHVSQEIQLRYGWHEFENMIIEGSTPTILFRYVSESHGVHIFSNADLTVNGNDPGTLLTVGTDVSGSIFNFRNIKTAAALLSGIPNDNAEISFYNVNNAASPYQYQLDKFAGKVNSETSIVRDASDGVTSISDKFVSNADCSYFNPLFGDEIAKWNDGTGEITLTLKALVNETLNDHEIGVDFYYLSANAKLIKVSTLGGDISDTPGTNTDTDDEANWTGESPTGLETYTFSSGAITPGQKGDVIARPWVRANTTNPVYFNPLIEGVD